MEYVKGLRGKQELEDCKDPENQLDKSLEEKLYEHERVLDGLKGVV
jgi:hypothetical protein